MAWVKASIPVWATNFSGIVWASSGSTIAISGVMLKSANGYLTPFSLSVITEKAVTSVAVPEVDGIAINLALFLKVGKEKGSIISLKVRSGYS